MLRVLLTIFERSHALNPHDILINAHVEFVIASFQIVTAKFFLDFRRIFEDYFLLSEREARYEHKTNQ